MGLTFQSSLRNSARGFSAKVALLNGRSIYEWKLYYNVFCDDLLFWEKLNINTLVLNTFYFIWKPATSLKYFEKYLIYILIRLNCFLSRKWPQFLLYKERRKLSRNCWHHTELCKMLALGRSKELLEQHLQSNVCYVPFIDKKHIEKLKKVTWICLFIDILGILMTICSITIVVIRDTAPDHGA